MKISTFTNATPDPHRTLKWSFFSNLDNYDLVGDEYFQCEKGYSRKDKEHSEGKGYANRGLGWRRGGRQMSKPNQ